MSKIISIEKLERRRNYLADKQLKEAQNILALKNKQATTPAEQLSIQYAIESCMTHYEELGKEIAQLAQELDNLKEVNQKPPSDPIFKNFSFQELLSLPPKQWLLEQVFGRGDLGVVYGPSGCGKTFIVIDMIVSLCQGESWAKRFGTLHPLKVAYFAGEGISGLPSRFAAAAAHRKVTDLPGFSFFNIVPQLYDTEHYFANMNRFIQECTQDVDLLVIDTLHTAISGAEENSSRDMRTIMDNCQLAIKKLNCALILVHHTNKEGKDERGSGSLRGSCDFMIHVEKGIMQASKVKDGEIWPKQQFILVPEGDSVAVEWDDPGAFGCVSNGKGFGTKAHDKDMLIQEMINLPHMHFLAKTLAEAIGQDVGYTTRMLNDLVQQKRTRRELLDPNKPSSSRNPWTYFI